MNEMPAVMETAATQCLGSEENRFELIRNECYDSGNTRGCTGWDL